MSEFDIFDAARKIPDDAARAAFVYKACAGDVENLAKVQLLLEADGLPCDFLDSISENVPPKELGDSGSTSTFVVQGSSKASSDSRIIAGKYKLIEQIGEGGMGTVYLANQLTPIRRKVAVKLIKVGHDTKAILARFSREQQAIALMNHPNIAKIFDAGTTDRNEPYFVMELIHGKPITAYCDDNRLTLVERIAIFIPVCQAIQHAHHRGIIHRDIKSTNILVAQYDGVPVAKVIDFGLAKAVGQELTDDSSQTMFGMVVGTLGYMSPEQATDNQLEIDARSDIYSLGAVLYELLTGSTPHEVGELKQRAFLEALRIIREEEPAKASHRLSSSNTLPGIAAFRRTDPRRLIGSLQGELDLVVMKALERERNRRYQHPSDFAEDLQRFLAGEPVHAAPPTLGYRFRKNLRKRWKAALVAASIAVTATAGAVGMGLQEYRRLQTVRESELNQRKRELAEAQVTAANAREYATSRNAELVRVRAASLAREAASSEYVGTMGKLAREDSLRAAGWAERSWELLQRAVALQTPLRSEPDIRSVAANVLIADEYRSKPDWTFDERARAAAYSPSGDTLVIAPYADYLTPNPRLVLIDASTGKQKGQPLSAPDNFPSLETLRTQAVNALRSRFEDCRFLNSDHALIAGSQRGRLYRWDLSKSPPEVKFESVGDSHVHLYVTPDTKWCVTHCVGSNQLKCWDSQTLKLVGGPVEFDTTNPRVKIIDNESILIDEPHQTRWISLPDFQEKKAFERRGTDGPFHPSGKFLGLVDGESFFAMKWPEFTRGQTYRNPHHETPLRSHVASSVEHMANASYSSSGQIFAVPVLSDRGEEIRLWDAWGGDVRSRLAVPAGSFLKWGGRVLSANAEHVAMIANDKIIQYSRIRPALASYRAPGHPDGVRYARTSPDGSELELLGERRKDGNDSVIVWKTSQKPQDLHSQTQIQLGAIPPGAFDALSYSPDGKWRATIGFNRGAETGLIISACGDPDRRQIITVPDEERSLGRSPFNANAVAGLGWSSSGNLVAAIDCELRAWDIQTTPPSLIARESAAEFLGRPHSYASVAMNGTEIGWALTIPSELRRFQITDARIEVMDRWRVPGDGNSRICRIDPNNRKLAIGKADGSIVLFDTSQKTFGAILPDVHADVVQAMVWLSDRRLATGSRDGSFALWDVDDQGQAKLWYALNLKAPVSDIAPTSDRRAVYIACSDETSLRVLDLGIIDREIEVLFSSSQPAVPSDPNIIHPEPDLPNHDEDIINRVIRDATHQPKNKIQINYTAEREAAKWVLSIGGSVKVLVGDGRELPLEADQLPEQDFVVRDIVIDGSPKFTYSGFSILCNCRALMSLRLLNLPDLTDESIALLAGSEIRSLALFHCPALSDKVTSSIGKLSHLESLLLQTGRLTDECLPSLAPLKRLSAVTITEPGITKSGLAKLAEVCPRISFLDISSAPQPSLDGTALASFAELTEAHISGSQFTDKAVQSLSSLPDLKTLRLVHSVDDDSIRRIEKLKWLRELWIQSNTPKDRTTLSPAIYADVAWPSSLTDLSFIGSKVAPDDDALTRFTELNSLRILKLDCRQDSHQPPRYTKIGLNRFRRLRPDVRFADEDSPVEMDEADYAMERSVAEWVLSARGTVTLKEATGNSLTHDKTRLPVKPFTVDGVAFQANANLDDDGLSKLVGCRRITDLYLANLSGVSDTGISNLRGASVRNLVITACPLITDESIASIAKFEGLESITLQDISVTDSGIVAFVPPPTLRALDVAKTQVADSGLLGLGTHQNGITQLTIAGSRDRHQSVRGIANFKSLTRLNLDGSQVTEEAISILNSRPTINQLQVLSPLSDETISRLGKLTTIQTLSLGSGPDESTTSLSPTFLSDAQWPERMQALFLYGATVSPRDEDLVVLAKIPNLKILGVDCVKELRHLQRYTYPGLFKLRTLRPDLRIGVEQRSYLPGELLPLTRPDD